MNIFHFISLFGGLALFLYGMRLMGDGLQQGSSGTLKKFMEKVANNPCTGFLLGLLVTAVIQSSTATIVLTSGLVGAGILTLRQSIGIILGANVGTTVTGQIIRLLDFDGDASSWLNIFKPSTLAPIAAIIGILVIMTLRSNKSDILGKVAMGFGILFTGLLNMTAAVEPLSESETFANLFIQMSDTPVLLCHHRYFTGLIRNRRADVQFCLRDHHRGEHGRLHDHGHRLFHRCQGGRKADRLDSYLL